MQPVAIALAPKGTGASSGQVAGTETEQLTLHVITPTATLTVPRLESVDPSHAANVKASPPL